MLVLALDSTSKPGSQALVRDGTVVAASAGDGVRAHAERLPGDLLALLAGCRLTLEDVDLLAVAAGPGSFTGLRVGIASMQGLAFAAGRPVVGISALDALAACADGHQGPGGWIGVMMDGQRGEVFAAAYRRLNDGSLAPLDGPVAAPPAGVLAAWASAGWGDGTFVGDGALRYGDAVTASRIATRILEPTPPLAPAIAGLAAARVAGGGAGHPHAIAPLYVRRPDAELARDRRAHARD